MSRIGKKPIQVPNDVQVSYEGSLLKAKGPKGELKLTIPEEIELKYENNEITFSRANDFKKVRAVHGLTRSLAFNVIEGVTNGFKKVLQIEGVGYRVEMKNKNLLLALGFSHPILVIPPEDITIETPSATQIHISGIDKQRVGQLAARIRSLRPPEPYKGKGIRYEGEYVRRKTGKSST
ncbi:MAG: 50S ribosomal protein L6 [Ignavibacteria bacterium]|nr:50S ribosomal protein L6 [Ignavibacteria bacterium]